MKVIDLLQKADAGIAVAIYSLYFEKSFDINWNDYENEVIPQYILNEEVYGYGIENNKLIIKIQ